MTKYILKRVGMALLTVFIVITITFFLMHAIPGGPFNKEKAVSAAVIEAMETKFGLNEPVFKQYIMYLGNILQGDFGPSIKLRGWEVIDVIKSGFGTSAQIGGLAAVLAITFGLTLGSIAALNHNKWSDRVIMLLSTLSVAVPSFIIGTMLLYLFGVKFPIFPTRGDEFAGRILPIITLSLYPMAYITRLTRSSMLETLGQDYIRTARAKGVSGPKVIYKHALRNAVTPVITYAGPMIAFILTGSLVVEKIFSVPGLGGKLVTSIFNRDYPIIMGVTIFLSLLMVTMNLIADILYKICDPRVNLG